MQDCWLVLSAAVDIASLSSQTRDGKTKSTGLPTFPSYSGNVDETKHSLTT
jgi:formylmethanofuran dehydrogenase subunit D